ncbi:MAG: hypothetical protein QM490_04860 [Candidatus Gracilibacteria bacterium]
MESWITLSIISGTLVGLSNFISKVSAHNGFNKDRIIFFGNIVYLLFSSVYLILNYKYVEVSFILFLLITLRIIAALQKNIFIIDSLKYIESGLFFPIFKIIYIFSSFIIGMLLFDEYLGITEHLAIFLGILMIILLSNKDEKKKQINYRKGIIYLLLANFALLFSSSINKYIASIDFDLPTYLFYSSVIGCVYLIFTKRGIYKKSTNEQILRELKYGLIRGFFIYFGFISIILAYKEGPLVLVGMISSIAILIPIVLSIIFYKEKLTINKILAFILFIIIIIILAIF